MSVLNAALKRAIVANLKPEDVPPGLYPLEHLCEIKVVGAVKRAEDSLVKSTVKLPVLEILALVVAKAGVMGPKILQWISEAVSEAHADPQGRGVAEYLETTKSAVRKVQDELVAKLPKMPRAGAFTCAVKVELLSATPLAVAMREFGEELELAEVPPLAG